VKEIFWSWSHKQWVERSTVGESTLAIVTLCDGQIAFRPWMGRWQVSQKRNWPLGSDGVLCREGWQMAGYPSGYPRHMMLLGAGQ
jgi:hypothetical protein